MNPANEIIDIEQAQGRTGRLTRHYDAAGNMISGAAVGREDERVHLVYDGRHRLVAAGGDQGGNENRVGIPDADGARGPFDPSDG